MLHYSSVKLLFRSYIVRYAYFIRIHILTEVENLNFESWEVVNILIVIYSCHVMLLWVYLCFHWILRETCDAWKISVFFVKRSKELSNFVVSIFTHYAENFNRDNTYNYEIKLFFIDSGMFLICFLYFHL